jgi:hypothetical protein
MKGTNRILLPLVLVFIIINAIVLVFNTRLREKGINGDVVLVANLLFFLVNLLVFSRQRKAMDNKNPNVFVRSVMAGMMVKMFVCIAAVIIYILAAKKDFNKPAVYFSMGIYVIYLAIEVRMMMKLNKPNNG